MNNRTLILISAASEVIPVWAQWLIGIGLVIVAIGVIWKKVLRPAATLISLMDAMLPLLAQMTEQFRDTPHAFAVLDEIIKEFRTDSGSSLRDVVNRLDLAAKQNTTAAEVLKANASVAAQLAAQDREQLARIVMVIDRLLARAKLNTEGVERLESGAAVVARELGAAQSRADETIGEPGAAADAAVQSPKGAT